MKARSYSHFLEVKRAQHGEKFQSGGLAPQFVPYFESGQRIKVKFSWGEVKSGTVGITTGWVPIFLLMLRSNSIGSSHTLHGDDTIVAVQKNGKYVPV